MTTTTKAVKATKASKAKKATVKRTPEAPVVQRDNAVLKGVSHYAPVVIKAVTAEQQVDDKSAALQAMLAAATQQTEAVAEAPAKVKRSSVTLVKVAASSSKDENGNTVQKRNRNAATRAIAVFTSESLKMCWMGTHLGFATKTAAGAMNIMRNAPQKALAPLQVCEDVVMQIEHKDVALGHELDTKKAETFDKYNALGYTMLCKRPKVATIEQPAVEAPVTTEQPVTA